MSLVISEVRVSLDSGGNILEFRSVLQFNVNHAAVNTLAERNGHRERVLHACLRAHAY